MSPSRNTIDSPSRAGVHGSVIMGGDVVIGRWSMYLGKKPKIMQSGYRKGPESNIDFRPKLNGNMRLETQ